MDLFTSSRKASAVENYLLPVVGLVGIAVIDRNVSNVLLTPALSICLLGLLALRLETKLLTVWFFIIWGGVVLALVDNPGGKAGNDLNFPTIVVRTLGFAVSGMIAVAMNKGRASLMRNHRHLLDMLERLPCAVAVSDSSGSMLFANKRALIMLKKASTDVVGLSFFSFFNSPEHRGNDIQSYLRLCEGTTSRETNLTLMKDSEERQDVSATQIPMSLVGHKCVVTVIDTNVSNRRFAEAALSTA
ncbi:hypothetical protein BH09VER1_BH09VER1_30870 [soil metagenome]